MEKLNRTVVCEALEERRLMSVSVGITDFTTLKNCLYVQGTAWGDRIEIYADGNDICVNTDSDSAAEATYSNTLVDAILVDCDSGDDKVNISNMLNIDAYIFGSMGKDTLGGGGGDDTIYGGDGNDVIDGDDGDDSLVGDSGNDYLEGDADDDTLKGESGKDELHGDSGNDWLNGGTGDDYVYGGSGDDILYSGEDSDYIKGGDDYDVVHHDDEDWYVVVT